MRIFARLPIIRKCEGYYIRWYHNGFHYWFFNPGSISLNTSGEKYRTISSREISLNTGQVTSDQIEAIRTIMNTREVSLLTNAGWVVLRVNPGSWIIRGSDVNGFEAELSILIGSRESVYSPITSVPSVIVPPSSPDSIIITTIIDGVFTIVITGTGTITIDWGDGSDPEVITLTGEATITHDFTGSGGTDTIITITGDLPGITEIVATNDEIIDIVLGGNLTGLTDLDLSDNHLTHIDIPDTLTELTTVDVSNNDISEPVVIPDTVPVTSLDTNGNNLCETQIGTQVWMCKNYDMDYPGSKVMFNNEENIVLGRLYKFDQIRNPGFLPEGYKVPSASDWQQLIDYVGGNSVAGDKLKSAGLLYWDAGNASLDEYGLDLRGGGDFNPYSNSFENAALIGFYWTNDEDGPSNSLCVYFEAASAAATQITIVKNFFLSLRLLRKIAAPRQPIIYNDWFLPSKDEVNEIKLKLKDYSIGNLLDFYYWSSTEDNASGATSISMQSGSIGVNSNKNTTRRVRACRAFTSMTNYNLRDIGPAGGWIFWKSGNDYLEAAPTDCANSIWSNITSLAIGTTGTAIGTGQANTNAIIAQAGHADSAAKLCNDYSITV